MQRTKITAQQNLDGYKEPGYLSFLRTLAVTSANMYDKAARTFCRWCIANGKEVELSTLNMYIQYMHDEKKIQTSTLWSVMGRLRAFFEHGVWNLDGRPYNVKRDISEVDHALKSGLLLFIYLSFFSTLQLKNLSAFSWWAMALIHCFGKQ